MRMRNTRSLDRMADEVSGDEYQAAALPYSWVGIPSTSIAAAASNQQVTIPILKQFRPDSLVLSTAAQALDINDVKVATTSLNISVNAVPGNLFSPDSNHNDLRWDVTASPSVGIFLFVTNTTAAAVVLKGALLGRYIP